MRLASRRGELLIRLAASGDIRSGQCYVPMGPTVARCLVSHGINTDGAGVRSGVEAAELKHSRAGRAHPVTVVAGGLCLCRGRSRSGGRSRRAAQIARELSTDDHGVVRQHHPDWR